MSGIEWETPPPARSGKRVGRMSRFVGEIKKQPGEWAVYRRDATEASVASQARARYPEAEWTSRSNKDGTYTIYARWVGDT